MHIHICALSLLEIHILQMTKYFHAQIEMLQVTTGVMNNHKIICDVTDKSSSM